MEKKWVILQEMPDGSAKYTDSDIFESEDHAREELKRRYFQTKSARSRNRNLSVIAFPNGHFELVACRATADMYIQRL